MLWEWIVISEPTRLLLICSIHRTSVFRHIVRFIYFNSIYSIPSHLISFHSIRFHFSSFFFHPYFSISHSSPPLLFLQQFSNKHSNPPYRNHPHSLSPKTSSQSKPIPFQSPLFALALIFDRFPSSSSSSSYPFPVIKSRLNPLECTA